MSTRSDHDALSSQGNRTKPDCCQGPSRPQAPQTGSCSGPAKDGPFPETAEGLREAVRERYAGFARQASGPNAGGGSTSLSDNPISRDLYTAGEVDGLPTSAVEASLGCGNPTALAELKPGDVVLDLGSGGGLDVLVSARRVGPTGKAYGLDMTDEMLALARRHQAAAGVANAEFLKGTLEAIPLPDNTVDVVISNCVINLSADKRRTLSEAFRVLKPGGHFAVSDVVVEGTIPAALKRSLELWSGCIAGALGVDEFKRLLLEVGFVAPEVEVTRRFGLESLDDAGREIVASLGIDPANLSGTFCSAFVRATKPA